MNDGLIFLSFYFFSQKFNKFSFSWYIISKSCDDRKGGEKKYCMKIIDWLNQQIKTCYEIYTKMIKENKVIE